MPRDDNTYYLSRAEGKFVLMRQAPFRVFPADLLAQPELLCSESMRELAAFAIAYGWHGITRQNTAATKRIDLFYPEESRPLTSKDAQEFFEHYDTLPGRIVCDIDLD